MENRNLSARDQIVARLLQERQERRRRKEESLDEPGDMFPTGEFDQENAGPNTENSKLDKYLSPAEEQRENDQVDDVEQEMKQPEPEVQEQEHAPAEPEENFDYDYDYAADMASELEEVEKEERRFEQEQKEAEEPQEKKSGPAEQRYVFANVSEKNSSRTGVRKSREFRPPEHRSASKSKASIEKMVEEERMKDCTFKPKIKELPKSGPYNYSKQNNFSRKERLERLSSNRQEIYERRQKEREKAEQESLKECTFKPKINKGSGLSQRQQIPLEDRLHHEADQRAALRERAKREQEEEDSQKFSFKPRINKVSELLESQKVHRPLHERIGQIQREKNEKLQKLRIEKELRDPNLTFSPRLSSKSLALAETKRYQGGVTKRVTDKDITERLAVEAQTTNERKSRTLEEYQRKAAEEYTFAPQISANSERIVAESGMFQGSRQDFLERQMTFEERKRQQKQMKKSSNEEDYTFQPSVGNADVVLASSGHPAAKEGLNERIERLTFVDKEKKEVLRETIAESYYSQFSFKPKISRVSKSLGRAMNVEELVQNDRGKRVKEIASKAAEDNFNKEHSFKPKINDVGARSRYDFKNAEKLVDNIEQQRLRTQQRLEEKRKEQEYEEIKDCTFVPETTKRPKDRKGPIIVRGLGRFLELQDLAKRLKEEKRERAEQAFSVRGIPPTQAHVPYTIPKPFKLHVDPNAAERKARIKRELEEKKMAECTFQPETTEMPNRELIMRILEEDDLMDNPDYADLAHKVLDDLGYDEDIGVY